MKLRETPFYQYIWSIENSCLILYSTMNLYFILYYIDYFSYYRLKKYLLQVCSNEYLLGEYPSIPPDEAGRRDFPVRHYP